MSDILKKIKDWDFTSKDSSISLNLNYIEIAEISDIVDRKLWYIGEIDDSVIETIIYNILRYNSIDKNIPIEKRKPIILYLNSVGGDTNSGLALLSAIKTSITPVYTVTIGKAESMALIVAISGHKRYSMPYTVYLMHDGLVGGVDNTSRMRDRMTFETDDLEKKIKDIILEHTNLTKKQYDDKYRHEWYFLPEEAKKYGFTDYIIGEDCDINEII